MKKNHSANLVLGPVVLTCLAASALVLSYWIFLRTPIQHVSPRAESEIRGTSMLLAGASGLLVAVALMCWWQPRVRHDTGFRARAFRMIAALPPWAVVMPVSLSASWVAARMALTTDPAADYWPAFALWLAAIVLLLVSLLPARSLRLPRFNLRGFTLAGFVRSEVTLLVLRRHNLVDPVGTDPHRVVIRHLGYSIAPPAGENVTVNLLAIGDVDLRTNPPAARAARAAGLAIERREDFSGFGFGASVAP